jgi:cyclopropane fatty-acyl-phospholipid synthase-like methyltransferase
MSRRTDSIPDDYFEALYAGGRDPWQFASSEYEREKYRATLATIGTGRIGRAWEVGCSIGVFTAALAGQCDFLLGVDVADSALAQARARCAGLEHVYLQRMRIPDQWADGRFDLIVFSEVLYVIRDTARRAMLSLAPRGRIVLVHWTGETDYPCTGDEAAALFGETCAGRLTTARRDRHPAYRLDLLQADASTD